VAALGAAYAVGVAGKVRVETDILAMLPAVDRDPMVEDAVRALSEATGRRTLFLVGAPDFAGARRAARDLAAELDQAAVFARVQNDVTFDAGTLDALYGPHRAALLSDRHRQWLAAGRSGQLFEDALHGLYTPAGWLRARPFAEDPLNLYGDFLVQQLPLSGNLRLQESVLAAAGDGREYVLVTAESAASPFAFAEHGRVEPAIAQAIARVTQRHPAADVLSSGVIRHAAAGSARGKAEIAAFGTVSLMAIVLLVSWTFRGPRPLLLTLTSLAVGATAALTACHFLFEKLHLITLVFGSTLTGVAVDYSIHYFADQFRYRDVWDPQRTLNHVGPAILIGMLATVLGYQALLLPPFPGLRQMAVFSVVGIASACATVLLAYPLLANRRPASHQPAALRLARRLDALRVPRASSAPARLAALALLALAAWGLARVEFLDDVRALQSSPAWLQQEEDRVREVLGGAQDSRFFLLEGATAEAVLQAEEKLRDGLNELVASGALAGYQAISRALPSQQRQRENHRLLAAQVYTPDGVLARLLAKVGYPPAAIERQRRALAAPAPLTPQAWLAHPASAPLRGLWLEPVSAALERGFATAVTLSGIRDAAALQALDARLPEARFIDRVARISSVLQRYRTLASACLVAAYVVIGLVLVLRYGVAGGLRLLLAPVGGAVLTLAALGALSEPVNLFNILALLLVLGMGVDYSVFMREGRGARATVIMAILLAGLMTLLSFGMLAFSATPFIRSLGLTVLLGVSFTFALALMASAPNNTGPPAESPAS
jgi:predicted exporter